MNRSSLAFAIVSVAAFVVGCGPSFPPEPPKAAVAGKVLLDGKPMPDGEVRFFAPGQPAMTLPVSEGAFSGEVYTGKNRVEVFREKEVAPHPMEPGKKIKANTISDQYSGPNSILSADVAAGGDQGLQFDAKSRK